MDTDGPNMKYKTHIDYFITSKENNLITNFKINNHLNYHSGP